MGVAHVSRAPAPRGLSMSHVPLLLLLALVAVCVHAGTAQATPCSPGEAFLTDDQCAVCVCGQQGDRATAFCTRRRCYNDVVSPVRSSDEGSCKPGEVFRRACNYCVCPGSGARRFATCTTRVCQQPYAAAAVLRRFRRSPRNAERCAPNIRYMDDCNLCICSADGIKAHSSCTFAQCPGKPR